MEYTPITRIAESLQGLRQTNSAFRFFDWVIENNYRERADSTALNRIVTAVNADRSEVVSLCRELDKLGIAKFMVGRRGKPSRVIWKYDLLDISKIAAGSGPIKIGTAEPPGQEHPISSHKSRLMITISKIPTIPTDRLAYSISQLAENLGVSPNDIDIAFKP